MTSGLSLPSGHPGRLAAVVLAGGAARRFGADKLAAEIDGRSLLDGAVAALPAAALVYVVGPKRPTSRPVTWLREDPPGGGPAAGLVCGLRAALDAHAGLIVVLPGDAPGAGPAADALLARLATDPGADAVVGLDDTGHEQPLQLALRRRAAEQLVDTAGPAAGANASARALVRRLEPPAVGHRLTPTQVWDVDTTEQLLVWRLATSTVVDRLAQMVDDHHRDPSRPAGRPVVVALDGPSCAGKSSLALALRLRTGGVVVEGDDFYATGLPALDPDQREAMGDAEAAAAVIDWRRLRTEALMPLIERRPATFRPYDWEAGDGQLAGAKTLRPADVLIVEGVYTARPELADLVDVTVHVGVDPQTRAARYVERQNDPAWVGFWERAEAYYFSQTRPPRTFDLQVTAELEPPP